MAYVGTQNGEALGDPVGETRALTVGDGCGFLGRAGGLTGIECVASKDFGAGQGGHGRTLFSGKSIESRRSTWAFGVEGRHFVRRHLLQLRDAPFEGGLERLRDPDRGDGCERCRAKVAHELLEQGGVEGSLQLMRRGVDGQWALWCALVSTGHDAS